SERLPSVLGLAQPVRDRKQHDRVVTHPEMAACHLDALALGSLILATAPPRNDAITPAVDRRERDCERRTEPLAELLLVRMKLATSEQRGREVRCFGITEWTRKCDHLAYIVRESSCELASIDTAEAPADQTHRPIVPATHLFEALRQTSSDLRARPEVAPETPAIGGITESLKESSQRTRRQVAAHETRQYQDRLTVSARCSATSHASAMPARCHHPPRSERANAPQSPLTLHEITPLA